MTVEHIFVGGERVQTLKERLRPSLKGVFVGINLSPVSVAAGHYYQGKLGKRFWKRLRDYQITGPLSLGAEDDDAYAQGFGFADLVRRPTRSSKDLSREELVEGARELLMRLERLGDKPLIIFVFAKAADAAEEIVRESGHDTFRMPGPYESKSIERRRMTDLRSALHKL